MYLVRKWGILLLCLYIVFLFIYFNSKKLLLFNIITISFQIPMIFVGIVLVLARAYRVIKGLEVIVRVIEIWIPIMICISIFLF